MRLSARIGPCLPACLHACLPAQSSLLGPYSIESIDRLYTIYYTRARPRQPTNPPTTVNSEWHVKTTHLDRTGPDLLAKMRQLCWKTSISKMAATCMMPRYSSSPLASHYPFTPCSTFVPNVISKSASVCQKNTCVHPLIIRSIRLRHHISNQT